MNNNSSMSLDDPSKRTHPDAPNAVVARSAESLRPASDKQDPRRSLDAAMDQRTEDRRIEKLLAAQTLESLDRARMERIRMDLEGTIEHVVQCGSGAPPAREPVIFPIRGADGTVEELRTLVEAADRAVAHHRAALADPAQRPAAQLAILRTLVTAIHDASGDVVRTHDGTETRETIFCSEGADMLISLAARSCADAGIQPEYAGTVGHVGNFTRIAGRLYYSDVNGIVEDVTDNVEVQDCVSAENPEKGYRTYTAKKGGKLSPRVSQGLFFSATRIQGGVHAVSNEDYRRWVLAGNTEGLLAQAEGDFASDPTLKSVGKELHEKLQRSAQTSLAELGIVSDPRACDWRSLAARNRQGWEQHHAELRRVAPGINELQETEAYAEEARASDADHMLSRAREALMPLFARQDLLEAAAPHLEHYFVEGLDVPPERLHAILLDAAAGDTARLQTFVDAVVASRDALQRLWSRANVVTPDAKTRDLRERMGATAAKANTAGA